MPFAPYEKGATYLNMSAYNITEDDLKTAADQFCPKCNAKKEKYLGKIMGQSAVMFRSTCSCETGINEFRKLAKSENQIFDELQIPFWKMMGQKPKDRDIKLEKFLKSKNMTYGDWRRYRDATEGKYQSALSQWNHHVKKYGERGNVPSAQYEKVRQESR